VELEPRQGMAAEASSAAVILLSSHFGYSLSTTHVATGSILGSGVGKRGSSVRWSVANRMFVAWVITLPAAALVGAGCFGLSRLVGGNAGSYVVLAVLLAAATVIFRFARRKPVNHQNVNASWDPVRDSESRIAESVSQHNPRLLRVKRKKRSKKNNKRSAR